MLTRLHPQEIFYAQGLPPLARPPVELRLTFAAERVQYIFVDTAEVGILRSTRIPVKTDKYGNPNLEEEEVKKFLYNELGRDDIKMRSFELMGGY